MSSRVQHSVAMQDFRRVRRRANLRSLLDRLTGQSRELLSYDEVRRQLKAVESSASHLEEIPLESIVGSVGRYNDFTRDFLPKSDSDEYRWTNVKVAVTGLSGVPAIEVYQIGDVYFVKDGNHRVSVAKQQGSTYIQAYVTKVQTKVPFSADIDPDELIVKAEQVDFLHETQLDRLRPDANVDVTVPGQYEKLLEHIEVHRYYMGLDEQRDVTYAEAVGHWYDVVYLPIVELAQDKGLLADFPDRTETDLYLWLAEYRADLESSLGWELRPETVAEDLLETFGRQGWGIFRSVTRQLNVDNSTYLQPKKSKHNVAAKPLFDDILVPIAGTAQSWTALDQAIHVARKETSQLYGLHVVQDESQLHSSAVRDIQDEFIARCQDANIKGCLAVVQGDVVPNIRKRAKWADLVITNLAHPPDGPSLTNNISGFEPLLRQTEKPVLAVPNVVTPLNHAVLAYDDSKNSKQALFYAAYLALKWQVSLYVLTVHDSQRIAEKLQIPAKNYLEQYGIKAKFQVLAGAAAPTILETVTELNSELLIIGSYEYNSLLEAVLGRVIEEILRGVKVPLLICR